MPERSVVHSTFTVDRTYDAPPARVFTAWSDPALKGRPKGFTLPIKEVRLLAGAGFLTAVCSGIQLMPGLPKKPAGERIDLDVKTGQIVGLS